MKKSSMPQGFKPFTWAIAGFCLPVALYPVLIMLSASISENPHLSNAMIRTMTIFFWAYPILLAIVARIWYVVHQKRPSLACWGLALSTVLFYYALYYCFAYGFVYDFTPIH